MDRQGPCLHCGIEQTPLWRTGPPGKPVLCNECGSRWQTRGKLDDHIPKNANREIQRYQLPSEMKPRRLARNDKQLEVGVQISGQDGSSVCLEEEMNNIPSLGSAVLSSDNCMQMEETNDKDPLLNPESVPRRNRSELGQLILSPVERIQRQLYNNLQEPDFEDVAADDGNITLIYARNKYTDLNEIGLGAMLLLSPTTTEERSKSLSPVAEDPCSKNVPVENLRVSGQELYSQGAHGGAEIGPPVKKPRGRPRGSTKQGRNLDKDRKSETADDSSQAWSSSRTRNGTVFKPRKL